MVEKQQTNDNTRRTFLQLLGVTGAATAGISTFSTDAAAETTSTTAMKTLDLNADDLVPANKFLSLSLPEITTDEIDTLDVLVDGISTSNVQMYQADEATGVIVSVFDMITNLDLSPGQTLPVKLQGTTASGESFVASDVINVIDPTSVLGNGSVSDEALTEAADGILTKQSTQTHQQQMY